VRSPTLCGRLCVLAHPGGYVDRRTIALADFPAERRLRLEAVMAHLKSIVNDLQTRSPGVCSVGSPGCSCDRFYRSRSRHKARETARTSHHCHTGLHVSPKNCLSSVASLPPSSFGSRFGGQTTKSLPRKEPCLRRPKYKPKSCLERPLPKSARASSGPKTPIGFSRTSSFLSGACCR
jgi:hypothetical protein